MLVSIRDRSDSNVQLQYQEESSGEKEEEYNALIDQIVRLALTSPNPEEYYQEISILHFESNRTLEALQAVQVAEEWAKKTGTAPLSIYLALFLRAKHFLHFGNTSDLAIAKNDLFNLVYLNEITATDKIEIVQLHNQIVAAINSCQECESLYASNLKSFFKRDMIYKPCFTEKPTKSLHDEYSRAIGTYNYVSENRGDAILLDLGYKISKPVFDKIIAGENSSELMLVNSLYCRVYINHHFRHYFSALEDIKKILTLDPNNEQIVELKSTLEEGLLKMSAKQRLSWINQSLQTRKNDPDLLLWKAEAHFKLAQIKSGVETAQVLLGIIDENHPHYETVLSMANTDLTQSKKS